MKDVFARRADSYLIHIALAVRVGDNGPVFRDFLDNWAAYCAGGVHLTSGGRPRWLNNPAPWLTQYGAVHDMDFVSQDAAVILARGKAQDLSLRAARSSPDQAVRNAGRLVVDHAVPLAELCKRLHSERIATPKAVEAFLVRWFRRGVLTHAEDELLRRAKLTKTMPRVDWWNGSAFARYEAVGIVTAEGNHYG